jgi:hypothetical protein
MFLGPFMFWFSRRGIPNITLNFPIYACYMLIYHGILYEYNKNIKIIIIKIIFLKLQEYKNITKSLIKKININNIIFKNILI